MHPGRHRVRPTHAASLVQVLLGSMFAIMGIALMASGEPSGFIWTLISAGVVVYHAANLRGAPVPTGEEVVIPSPGPSDDEDSTAAMDAGERLQRLDGLHAQGLLSYEEYSEQRRRIIQEL